MRRFREWAALSATSVLVMLGQSPAAADVCPPPPSRCDGEACTVVLGDCEGDRKTGTRSTARLAGSNQAARSAHPERRKYVVSCSGNSVEAPDFLCEAATTTCPDLSATRYWIFSSTWSDAAAQYQGWKRRPDSVCLSPAALEEGEDPLLALAAAVRSQWRNFGLPKAAVTTLPGEQTLTGAVTRLVTAAPIQSDLPAKDVLGYRVRLNVTAQRYVWDFGDGDSVVLPSNEASRAIDHVYRSPGGHTVTLRTIYRATFSAAGTSYANEPLDGEADVSGLPTALTVREARTQLEAGLPG